MTHASLFSGIGGFDLAAEWAGWTNLFNCEIDPFCQTVLKHHFPNAKQYSDIRATDFIIWRGRIDVLTGGFPCQPFSHAGKRKGTDDERHLWPEMLRAIREISPNWVVGENVFGIVNWSKGLVFEQVCADLEAEGYEVQPFIIPAAGVGAPHRRDRVWFIAHTNRDDAERRGYGQVGRATCEMQGEKTQRERLRGELERVSYPGAFANNNDVHNKGRHIYGKDGRTNSSVSTKRYGGAGFWEIFPTQCPVYRGDDGLSDRLDRDAVFAGRKQTRKSTRNRWREDAIKAYGNAIVPQVAYRIFDTIDMIETILK